MYGQGPLQLGDPEKRQYLLAGVKDVENGLLYQIISSLLVAIGVIGISATLLAGMSGPGQAAEKILAAGAAAATLLGLILAGTIIAIVGFVKIYSGFTKLAVADRNYGIGATGVKIMVIGLVIALLSLLIIIVGVLSESIGIAIGGVSLIFIGALAMIVGSIMVIIGFWRLGNLEDGSFIHIGVILMIVGGLAYSWGGSLLSFIGTILVYLGVRKVRETLEQQELQPPGGSYQAGAAPSL